MIVANGAGWASAGYKIVDVTAAGLAILDSSPTIALTTPTAAYDLIQSGTMWPAQWQDTTCALSWAADNLCVNFPHYPQNLVLTGHSAAGNLVLASGLIPVGTFPSTCDHINRNYIIQDIIALSPPSDLRALYTESVTAQKDIRSLLEAAFLEFAIATRSRTSLRPPAISPLDNRRW